MSRVLQLVGAWLAMWVLYAVLIFSTAPHPAWGVAALVAFEAVAVAAVLSIPVIVLVDRLPWPRPFRFHFLAAHAAGALAFAVAWILLTGLLDAILQPPGFRGFRVARMVLGAWLYAVIVGLAYAIRATARAMRLEALMARAQLEALRGQLNPHFLFNALHTVVQLIPVQPREAAEAATRLGDLLRLVVDEDRDLVRLADDWAVTSGYLEIEKLRFGDRLTVDTVIDPAVEDHEVPSFTLQTLVENAVRHGVAAAMAATRIEIRIHGNGERVRIAVTDDGPGAQASEVLHRGSGLRRLRDRLEAHYGKAARCEWTTAPGEGFHAVVTLPVMRSDAEGDA